MLDLNLSVFIESYSGHLFVSGTGIVDQRVCVYFSCFIGWFKGVYCALAGWGDAGYGAHTAVAGLR